MKIYRISDVLACGNSESDGRMPIGWPVHRNDNSVRAPCWTRTPELPRPELTLFPPRSLQNILKIEDQIEETSDKGEREDSGHGCSRATAPQLQGKAVVHGG